MGGRKDLLGARIGTSFDAKRWLTLDPCGIMGLLLSASVHLFAFATITTNLIEGMFATAVFLLGYTPVTLLALWSLYMAWTTDPGSVPMGARPLVTVKRAASGDISSQPTTTTTTPKRDRALSRCHKCNENYKPPRAHHDSVTGRCIVKFDHFCPWVGNSIGALNHKFFVLFIFYTVLSCLFSLLLMLIRYIRCTYMIDGNDKEEGAGVIGLFVVSLVFLMFTCCMLCEQVEAIKTNASKIARMKMRVGHAGTELSRVTEEFNEMFGGHDQKVAWHWFLPLSVDFPRGMRKVVLGYEWDETFDPVPYDEDARATAATADAASGGGDEEQGKIELMPRTAGSDMSAAAAAAVSTLKSPPPMTSSGLDTPSAVAAAAAAAATNNGSEAAQPFTTQMPSSSSAETLTKRSNTRASSQERHLDVTKGTLT